MNKALLAVIAVLALSTWYFQHQAQVRLQENFNLRAENGELIQEGVSTWSKLLFMEKQIRGLKQDSIFKDLKLDEMMAAIKRKDGTIKTLMAFQVSAAPETVTVAGQQDTVLIDARTRKRVQFAVAMQGDTVTGLTLTDPPEAWVRLKRRPVAFAASVIEKRDGSYETLLTCDNPSLIISAVNGTVVPYDARRGFLRRFFSGPAVSLGWTRERGATVTAAAGVWKILPEFSVTEHGTDYGASITVWGN